MQEQVIRKLFLGFINLHILHHAKKEPFFGSWMIDELKNHGYSMSAGTLYPILHNLEKSELLKVTTACLGGKIRKYYAITEMGEAVLIEATIKAKELIKEIVD